MHYAHAMTVDFEEFGRKRLVIMGIEAQSEWNTVQQNALLVRMRNEAQVVSGSSFNQSYVVHSSAWLLSIYVYLDRFQ